MENVYMCDALFLDGKTIQLFEEYPFSDKEIQLIILPKKISKPERKAGLLKGKIRMTEGFDEPLEDMGIKTGKKGDWL
ncbi:Uncharacterized protein dnl_14540 [Desulfonema limicola]|uniref:Uncharacterized protein n=1 Tax=Desulfonema limicola TaxID=45656 RepID=A0A975GFH9_9BACT|nr:hypothetical protein [Desulfonema limicola]QTA79200.1 Uncharacterized protein dnl_14540 [Desulfonema limicola]